MPIDKFEGRLVVKSRDRIRDEFLRDFRLRQPLADTAPGSQPHFFGTNIADALVPMYANVPTLGAATTFLHARGVSLDERGKALGRRRKGHTGAIGYVVCETAQGGSNVVQGDVLKETKRNLKFRILVTQAVDNGQAVAIQGIDTGPATNLPAGTELRWLNPRVGMGPKAAVFQNPDGSGLTGGALEENDSEYQAALLNRSQNPPAMGNESQLLDEIEKIQGIAIQQGFIWSAIKGAGTKAVAFTMRPAVPGASRIPNGAQIAFVEATLKSVFPFDDGFIMTTLLEQHVAVVLRATWKAGAASFVDQVPWPPHGAPNVKVSGFAPITGTAFRVTTAAQAPAPAPGKTIALYDPTSRVFKAKRIQSVAPVGAMAWDLAFETTVPTSDTAFAPAAGAIVSPWAPSMQELVLPILRYFDLQGPGEMVPVFEDPGRRKRRYPEPAPENWPSRIENRMLDPIFGLTTDATIAEPPVPSPTMIGVPPGLAFLHRCTDIAVYPQ